LTLGKLSGEATSGAAPAFLWDVGSPYAWLAAERVDELIPGVEWRPVLLGGIFRATGRSSWARTDRRAEGIAEVERRARERGLPALRWPAEWPNDGLLAMRVAAAAALLGRGRELALCALRLQFTRGRAMSEPEAVAEAAEAAGLVAGELLGLAASAEVKAALRAQTERALAAGVVGVPAVVVGGEAFWGDDRLDEAAARARSIA
jgi:2-hydroxychromene-2-carboxylate isomerase